MEEFTQIVGGIKFGGIITNNNIYNLMRESEATNFLRSGCHRAFGDFKDLAERVCKESREHKRIRMILPSVFNEDLVARCIEAGEDPEAVRAQLHDWQERWALLGQQVTPAHTVEIRTTMCRHRYAAIFSEKAGILGPPWHFKASLTTSSFIFNSDATSVLTNLHEDYEALWTTCRPYKPGDNERDRKAMIVYNIDDPVLLRFKKLIPWVLSALKHITSAFPASNGNGATKAHLHAKFGTDEASCNSRMLQMEHAGLLRKVGDGAKHDRGRGRVATWYGEYLAHKYRNYGNDLGR